ncbi:glycoside hydrolase family 6 protein [Actinoplanes sp. NPDC051851]|uniref:glycoside hydrolase family 6 protein n=1 Tax=Actinoplanes sp. NPDC051851 TaxID=3154753 RepID=UPI00342146DA
MGRHVYTGGRWRRGLSLAALLAVAVTGVFLLRDRGPAPAVHVPAEHVPSLTEAEQIALYVDSSGAAAEQVTAMEQAGRADEAAVLRRIAEQPVATWLTGADDDVQRVTRLTAAATEAGRLPVIVLYDIPHRDCAGHSGGGAPSDYAYRKWILTVIRALRGHRVLAIVEPDAVAQTVRGCLGPKRTIQRYELLTYAVTSLRALPNVAVYLDAGNPTWVPADQMAPALRRAGIESATGFALNVANFETTQDNLRYGAELSALLDGRHFVVDTSRNGNGPAQRGEGDHHWCNPPGRRLGETPTLETGEPLADAYLWVKRPGESDGTCGTGAPPAGHWFPSYALSLAR